MHWVPLILTSLFAMYFMNLLAIVAGYTVILLVPRSLIDWIGFFCFLLFGIFCAYEGLNMESKSVTEEYEEEIQRLQIHFQQKIGNLQEQIQQLKNENNLMIKTEKVKV